MHPFHRWAKLSSTKGTLWLEPKAGGITDLNHNFLTWIEDRDEHIRRLGPQASTAVRLLASQPTLLGKQAYGEWFALVFMFGHTRGGCHSIHRQVEPEVRAQSWLLKRFLD